MSDIDIRTGDVGSPRRIEVAIYIIYYCKIAIYEYINKQQNGF